MKILFGYVAAVFFWLAATLALADDTGTAVPISRPAPEYPVACMPAEGDSIGPQTVTVKYDVNRNGRIENAQVIESSNSCFDEVSIATIRGWFYEERLPQVDLETTFTFIFEEETQSVDFDARVLYREPPLYPDRCQRRAKGKEWVVLEFDISGEGVPENISIIESTNSCFNTAAKNSVEKWRYRPRLVNGEPARREGVLTQITFQLAGRVSTRPQMRQAVYTRLKRVERLLSSGDHEQALEVLNKLESRFGDSFSRMEHTTFLRLRAGVKIAMNDYAGALDDLRIVQRSSLPAQANEEVGKLIVQLEAIVAAQAEEQLNAADEETAPTEEE